MQQTPGLHGAAGESDNAGKDALHCTASVFASVLCACMGNEPWLGMRIDMPMDMHVELRLAYATAASESLTITHMFVSVHSTSDGDTHLTRTRTRARVRAHIQVFNSVL